jgi:hypothetical protein
MTPNESKSLKKGSLVYWQGDPNDAGVVTETSWDAVDEIPHDITVLGPIFLAAVAAAQAY